jgi:hypothetical protein
MDAKTFEIRDEGTFIPALAVKLNPACEQDRYLLGRAGYGIHPDVQAGYVIVVKLEGCNAQYNSSYWGNGRTMEVAHSFIMEHFDELSSGAVIDVEYILGERTEPKVSEAEACPI